MTGSENIKKRMPGSPYYKGLPGICCLKNKKISGRIKIMVLCGSNGYDRKYYFNEEFASIPDEVQKELQILCVWFTEECGGILTMEFDQDGVLQFKHITSEYDGYYDEIGADLKIKQYREEKKELLESLELYYKLLFLGLDE